MFHICRFVNLLDVHADIKVQRDLRTKTELLQGRDILLLTLTGRILAELKFSVQGERKCLI